MALPKSFGDSVIATSRDTGNLLVAQSFKFAPQLRTNGITSFTMVVKLARNALVRSYDIVVSADRASGTAVEQVAQVRAIAATDSEPAAIILDFGTPRTVSVIQVQEGLSIVAITPWIGTAFAPSPVFAIPESVRGLNDSNTVILRKEIRTERLLVEVTGNGTGPDLW